MNTPVRAAGWPHWGQRALVVGVVNGIGEASALLLRLASGPLTDRTQRFWA